MPKYHVHFEASAAVGVELAVEADNETDANVKAQKLWDDKAVASRIGDLIDIDISAREGFADAIGLTIPYAIVSVDEGGFELVDTFIPKYPET